MRRVVVTGVSTAALLVAMGGMAGAALADPSNKPLYQLACENGQIYTVTSPDRAAAGQDTEGTAVLVLLARPGIPEDLLTTCTVTEPEGGSFEADFLITPV